ncbi:MAG: ThuA domain-containing protein [Planctomycetes bacterium]|nr:ThuA domain-containing protein [Planctomycetota bacterium]
MTQSFLRPWFALVAACLLALTSSAQAPLRVFLRGGPKTHGPGEHDHPAFVADWQPARGRGAVVEGALRFPTREELEHTDVLVLYAAEAGSIHGEERAVLEAYLARGGGLVAIHDAVCGDDPHWFKTVVGGAWEHGHAKWATGTTDLYVRDFDHPITRGVANWRFEDELYTELHLEPDAHVLMAGFQDVFTISPQMWTYEKANYRAFVAIQGHFKKSFEHDAWRTLLLRGIAWAGEAGRGLPDDAGGARDPRVPHGRAAAAGRGAQGAGSPRGLRGFAGRGRALDRQSDLDRLGPARPHVGRGDAGLSHEGEVQRDSGPRHDQRPGGFRRRRGDGPEAGLRRQARPGHDWPRRTSCSCATPTAMECATGARSCSRGSGTATPTR